MKSTRLLLFSILLVAACQKDQLNPVENLPTSISAEERAPVMVNICHKKLNGSFVPMTVPKNALQGHLAHGDYLPDADNDGYTAIGACSGSQNDCDDNNASVNPGAAEICDNNLDDDCDGLSDCDDPDCSGGCTTCLCFDMSSLNAHAPFYAYYDSDISTCPAYPIPVNGVWIIYDATVVAGAMAFEYQGNRFVATIDEQGQNTCLGVVGDNITLADWEACRDLLREAIAANPSTPNYCDVYAIIAQNGGSNSQLVSNQNFAAVLSDLMRQMKP